MLLLWIAKGIYPFLLIDEISLERSYPRSLLSMRFSLGLPSVHPHVDAASVAIVPPPNLSNQIGLKQIPGNLIRQGYTPVSHTNRIDSAHPFRAPVLVINGVLVVSLRFSR